MNDCRTIQLLVDDWLDDLLLPDDLHSIESHLNACSPCRSWFDAHRRLATDMLSISRAADRIAAKLPTPIPVKRGLLSGWRAAAALLFVAGTTLTMAFFFKTKPTPHFAARGLSERTDSRAEQGVSAAPSPADINPIVAVASNQLAVQMETKNPSIHLVWVYDRPARRVPEDATNSKADVESAPFEQDLSSPPVDFQRSH